MDKTTSRLRKTFKYPTDNNEDDDLPEAMDEEEQTTLIQTLQTTNAQTNKTYTHLLLSLPLLSILPYLPSLLIPKTSFLSLLSITSLTCTSYLLFSLPPEKTGFGVLDALHSQNHSQNDSQNQTQNSSTQQRHKRRKDYADSGFGGGDDDDGPIKKYLPYLNLALCIVLAVLGTLVSKKVQVWRGFSWVPAFVFGIVVGAKWVMGSVDPEGELGGLRYGFKGA